MKVCSSVVRREHAIPPLLVAAVMLRVAVVAVVFAKRALTVALGGLVVVGEAGLLMFFFQLMCSAAAEAIPVIPGFLIVLSLLRLGILLQPKPSVWLAAATVALWLGTLIRSAFVVDTTLLTVVFVLQLLQIVFIDLQMRLP